MPNPKPPALVYPLHSRIKLVLLRWLYTGIMYLATPIILYRLFVRGLKLRSYLHRWAERFGYFKSPGFARDSIWVHAVSVGELNAAIPLITALRERYADWPMVVTTVTPTGSERLRQVFGDSLFHVYLPYDLPGSVRRFLSRIRPRLAIIMETEIWPNLYFACRTRGIPVLIANARLDLKWIGERFDRYADEVLPAIQEPSVCHQKGGASLTIAVSPAARACRPRRTEAGP